MTETEKRNYFYKMKDFFMELRHGTRLGSFRSGDRSEYMALYFLSRIAFVSQIPHQEDFGVADFLCCLGKEEDDKVYAENGFFVQVKSNKKPIEFKI